MRSDEVVAVVTVVAGVTGVNGVTSVRVPAARLSGWFVHAPWLGALLHRVSPLRHDRSLSRLDTSHLVDLNLSLRRVLNVDIHQGRMERYWKRTDPPLKEQCKRGQWQILSRKHTQEQWRQKKNVLHKTFRTRPSCWKKNLHSNNNKVFQISWF